MMVGKEKVDVLVIGAGIVGCAVARELTVRGVKKVMLVDKNDYPMGEASAGNSGIFHTGFDAPPGSIEQQCMALGHQLLTQLYHNNESFQQRVKVKFTGALLVAWTAEEEAKLPEIIEKAQKNGIEVKYISHEHLHDIEPNLSPSARAAISIPTEAIIDPFSLAVYFLEEALLRTCKIRCSSELIAANFDHRSKEWNVTLKQAKRSLLSHPKLNQVSAKCVINCAGNYGDWVEQIILHTQPTFNITPRKGQFAVFDTSTIDPIKGIILPIPTDITKGVLVSQTVFGKVIVGPTAEDQTDRSSATTDEKTISSLIERAYEIVPALRECKVVGRYAGLRPSSQFRDYQIRCANEGSYLCVGGIRSTGLTACMGIAKYAVDLLRSENHSLFTSMCLNDSKLFEREEFAYRWSSRVTWHFSNLFPSFPYPSFYVHLTNVPLFSNTYYSSDDSVKNRQKEFEGETYTFEINHWLVRIAASPPSLSKL